MKLFHEPCIHKMIPRLAGWGSITNSRYSLSGVIYAATQLFSEWATHSWATRNGGVLWAVFQAEVKPFVTVKFDTLNITCATIFAGKPFRRLPTFTLVANYVRCTSKPSRGLSSTLVKKQTNTKQFVMVSFRIPQCISTVLPLVVFVMKNCQCGVNTKNSYDAIHQLEQHTSFLPRN